MEEKEQNRPEQPSDERKNQAESATPDPAPPAESTPPAPPAFQTPHQQFQAPPVQPYQAAPVKPYQSPHQQFQAPPVQTQPGPQHSAYTHPPQGPAYVPPAEPEPRRRGFVGPLILIFIGLIFLLNNLGIVDVSIWELLWRLWPVWLIAIGVDLLFGRRGGWVGWLALAIAVTMLGGAFYYGSVWPPFSPGYRAEVGQPQAIDQPLDGAQEARVEIKSGVSRLTLRDGAAAGSLIQGEIIPLVGERVRQDFRGGSVASYTLSTEFRGNLGFGDRGASRWDLQLNDQIPLALTLETGVGRSNIDLSRLTVTDLRINSGVGETDLVLPAQGQLRGRIESGVGQTTIRIPDGMAARIRVRTGVGGVTVRGDFNKEGAYYITPDYSSAKNRVDLEINGGVGGVRIELGR